MNQCVHIIRRVLACLIGLGACSPATTPPSSTARPMRVVSLDYCADQYVLKLADRDQILALSRDADKDFSYMRHAAQGIARVRSTAEDVLALRPDLVVRAYGGGPGAVGFFERAGIPVLQLAWVEVVDGEEKNSVPGVIEAVADRLGQRERGAKVISSYRERLSAIAETLLQETDAPQSPRPTALYLTPGGVTTGPGSLVHEILRAAGLTSFETRPGWHALPLERLAGERPDVIAIASFGAATAPADPWSAAGHPIVRKMVEDFEAGSPRIIALQGAWTGCGGWFLLDAVEALSRRPAP